ncbi:hemerythrin domain-containing protein [Ruegeria marina]|uniref:Iron-sulfur cluster repair protein YtfE, RIC family, contains ScdAN and hemerythrin domains n=1 Tax=Ruegeria marina TaxID=639004 RepID=A0A1G6Z3K4_9RHOB|nr:hemerythrin domain-containing protein [Ruegeria marina]SDD97344.1 Iron-sulfur cluster repair protein YtfE, RIC family, contains ScdAN and hemerythrin domains [Ruegeria marina]
MRDEHFDTRTGLPEALRVLLEAHPRESWQADPNFHGLVSFWLERHMMFRQIMAHMQAETRAFLNADRDTQLFSQGIARYGGMFVNQLHGHHQIEDHHYFPLLRTMDSRIETGFDLLDADHHALDGLLSRFVEQANAAIRSASGPEARSSAGALLTGLGGLERMIGRHLEDEEDLIVPIILKHGTDGLG